MRWQTSWTPAPPCDRRVWRSWGATVDQRGRAGAYPRDADEAGEEAIDTFVRRLQGVIVARNYVLVDYDINVALVDEACAITPGWNHRRSSPLRDSSWVAIRAMVPREGSTW